MKKGPNDDNLFDEICKGCVYEGYNKCNATIFTIQDGNCSNAEIIKAGGTPPKWEADNEDSRIEDIA